MVGHLLEYHPAVARLRALIEADELGPLYYLYGNRLNLGVLRSDENALWSLGAHDVSVALHLIGEEPVECTAQGASYVREGRRGRRLLLPALPLRDRRAPAPVLARPAQGAAADGRRRAQDGDVRRHARRGQAVGLRQGLRRGQPLVGRVHHALGRRLPAAHRQRRAAAAGVRALPRLRAQRRAAALGRCTAGCASCACSSACSARWRRADSAPQTGRPGAGPSRAPPAPGPPPPAALR